MPTIDDLTIQRIKDAADIVDVVGDFVDLKKRGVRYLGLCPFHDDKHLGSFVVYPKGNVFKCFRCDAKGGPIEFLMMHENLTFPDAIRWLGKKYSIDTDMEDFNYTPPQRPKPAPLPMLTLPMTMVNSREGDREQNTLVRWLRDGIGWDNVQRKRIDQVLNDYHVGTNRRNGMTIFWQIDEQQQVRTGKMMLYRPDGHRDRDSHYNFDWIHSALYRDPRTGYSADKTDVKPCLFGLHLLNHYRTLQRQQVCIVESEKTALLMAIAYGNHAGQVWMACGGKENLNREKLKPIIEQKRDIILYPDRDSIDIWKAKAENLHYDRVTVDCKPVTEWWKPEDGEKADIADVVIRMINNSKTYKTAEEVVEDMPKLKALHEKFNLEIAK